MAKATHDGHGHRQRLRERMDKAGPDALSDHELLELLLFGVIPRQDTKPIAKALLREFKTLEGVIAAPVERLKSVDKIGDAAAINFRAIHAIAGRVGRQSLETREVISSWNSLIEYCRTTLQHESREQFRVLYLDTKNQLIEDRLLSQGTVDRAAVYPRDVVKRALEVDAAALILVHNHPSGDPTPSRADIDMTREMVRAAAPLELKIHDHIIVGKKDVASLRTLGLMGGA